jgi:hypothetical protein
MDLNFSVDSIFIQFPKNGSNSYHNGKDSPFIIPLKLTGCLYVWELLSFKHRTTYDFFAAKKLPFLLSGSFLIFYAVYL